MSTPLAQNDKVLHKERKKEKIQKRKGKEKEKTRKEKKGTEKKRQEKKRKKKRNPGWEGGHQKKHKRSEVTIPSYMFIYAGPHCTSVFHSMYLAGIVKQPGFSSLQRQAHHSAHCTYNLCTYSMKTYSISEVVVGLVVGFNMK